MFIKSIIYINILHIKHINALITINRLYNKYTITDKLLINI